MIDKSRLIASNNKKILVLEKIGPKKRYTLPGGIQKQKESELDSLIRETKEEIGLKIKAKDLQYFISRRNMNHKEISVTKHYFISKKLNLDYLTVLEDHKFSGVFWIPWYDAIAFMDKDDMQAVTLYFNQIET